MVRSAGSRLRRAYQRVRRRLHWERQWRDRAAQPSWLVEGPRDQVRLAREEGWIVPGASIVDLGCGIGNTAAWLAGLGHEVWAVDYARAAIRRARKRYRDAPGLRFDRVDVTRPMTVGRQYDVVLDLGCVHQLPGDARDAYAANVRRLTRAGGRLLVLLRVWGNEAERTPAGKGAGLLAHLGDDFELVRAEATQLQGDHTDQTTPGVELRFLRRAARTR